MHWFDVKSSFDLLIPGNQPIFLVVIVTAGVMLLSYMFWNCYYYDISLVSKKNISVMEREDDCPQNGIILLVMAFLVSPYGLPLAAIWLLGKVQNLRYAIQDAVYS